MKKIKIIAIGTLSPEYKNIFQIYAKSIAHFCEFSVQELKEFSEEKNIELKKHKETVNLLSKLNDENSKVILLSLEGKQIDSIQNSQIINENSNLTFVIGGSDGLEENLFNNSLKISFSKMTFPHQLFRVMLAEQIYRAFMIINNKKYHK